jgi:glucosyl-3-phosphoglycerate synthase
MRPDARAWFESRTTSATSLFDIDAEALLRAKRRGGHRISVVLPARDEEATVGRLVADLRRRWVREVPLVDELVVMDSDSTDRTGEVAAAAGADVVRTADVLPAHGTRPGKGEALWKALAATTGDLLVFVDADLVDFDPRFVVGLLGPLLTEPSIGYVKALYDRPLTTTDGIVPSGGGRVTELVARPLLNAFWPELAGFVQPLSGEYAGRRELLEQVPFVSGYGVELGLLVDLVALAGLDALAQVDLGTRQHTHQADAALGRMAGQILQTALARRPGGERPERELLQFLRTADGLESVSWDVGVVERPPMRVVRAAEGRRRGWA